jgi:hypothetical protein
MDLFDPIGGFDFQHNLIVHQLKKLLYCVPA